MPNRKARLKRQRGRPPLVDARSGQPLTTNDVSPGAKLAMMEEASARSISLSLYAGLILNALTREERDVLAARAFSVAQPIPEEVTL